MISIANSPFRIFKAQHAFESTSTQLKTSSTTAADRGPVVAFPPTTRQADLSASEQSACFGVLEQTDFASDRLSQAN